MAAMRVGIVMLTMVASAVFVGCNTLLAADTFQPVLTIHNTNVVFGVGNTFNIIYIVTIGGIRFANMLGIFFGRGFPGTEVRTDVAVTLGPRGDASRIYACIDGRLQLVDVDPSGTPQNAIVRVRYNSTDGYYRLQITEAAPPVFVKFTQLSDLTEDFLCTPGIAGSPITFMSNFFPPPHDHLLHEPRPTVLRQEADI